MFVCNIKESILLRKVCMFLVYKFIDSFIVCVLIVLCCVYEYMEKICLMVVFVVSFMKYRMYFIKFYEIINYYVFMKL